MRIKIDGVEAGGNTGDLLITDYTPGGTELRTNLVDRPNGDGQMVGQDYLGSSTWGFAIKTNTSNLKEAIQAVASLERVWKKSATRMDSNVPKALEYSLDGSTWFRIYGRPGAFTGMAPNVLAKLGVGMVDCDFTQTVPQHFKSTQERVTLTIVPATTGGLVAPLIAPLTTLRTGGEREGFVDNSGDVPTPLKVVFRGPIKDPKIRSAKGYELGYRGTLKYDQRVEIDALLGTVKLFTGTNSGVNVAGRLTVKSRLSAATIPVGRSEYFFSGSDNTGTAKAEILWRSAYTGLQY